MIRSLAIAAILLGSTSFGYAADLAALPLRGTIGDIPQAATWDGFYVAGHGGYANANLDLTKLGQNQVSYLLRNTALLSETNINTWTLNKRADSRGTTYGGLAGYNIQMENTIVGVEADYTRANGVSASSADSQTRILTLSDGSVHSVSVSSGATAKLTDYATLRGRVGYAFGDLMAFVTGGVAVGRFQTSAGTTVVDNWSNTTSTPPIGPIHFAPPADVESKKDDFKLGYTGGIGLEYMFGGGIFARAEYQYVAFGSFGKTDIHSARAAVGVKF